LTRNTIILKIFFRWFLDVFILVRMRFAFGLQSNQFALKVIPFRKVLKNAQNGSGSTIREGSRGRVLGGQKNALRAFKGQSATVFPYYF
jgi:hypothetical protein